MSSIYVMTGATSGLGLKAAERLLQTTDALIIAGVRHPEKAAALKSAVSAERLVLLTLDTSSQKSVRDFTHAVRDRVGQEKISSVLCIAGLQLLGSQQMNEDGIDLTFATNVLGHIQLIDELRSCLKNDSVVVTIGSGTHDPSNRLASRAGFLGADYVSARSAAEAQSTRPGRGQIYLGLDRYATSKLCAIYHAAAAATEQDFSQVRFYCFDPGLMPGTELVRQRGAAMNFAWKYIMPILTYFIEGVSTPRSSARMLIDELILGTSSMPSGAYVEFTGKPAPISKEASNLGAAKKFLSDARMLLKPKY